MDEELKQMLTACGNSVGAAMGAFRLRLDDARTRGDEEAATVAELLYLKAADIQHKRNQIVIADIMESDEIRKLMTTLDTANKRLENDIKEVASIEKRVGELKKGLAQIESALGKLISLIA